MHRVLWNWIGGGDENNFRIKIGDKNNNDVIVYDNEFEVDDYTDPPTALTHLVSKSMEPKVSLAGKTR
jgi:hypothetical protein